MKSANEEKEKVAPKPKDQPGMFANMFHCELNLYSFSTLVFVYHVIPEGYKVVLKKVTLCLIALGVVHYYQLKG
jgi:hypothetical protein